MSTSLTHHDAPPFAPGAALLALARQDAAEDPIELSGEPLTIGAGPRCTLRLSGTGLRPLHCVVTPTETGPVVRRWAEGTRINGEDFTESPLAVGDRLTVGEVEFEVIDLQPGSDFVEEPSCAVEPEALVDPAAEAVDPEPLPVQPVETLEEIQAEVASLVEDQAPASPEPCEDASPCESVESIESSFYELDPPTESTPDVVEGEGEVVEGEVDEQGESSATADDLFQDWAPAEGTSVTETPSDEFLPVDEIVEETSQPDPSADDLWGVATPPSTPEALFADAPFAEVITGEEDAAAAWQAEFDSPQLPTEEPVEAPSADAIASFASVPAVDPTSLATPSEAAPAAWRGRLTAGRERVRRLTQAVRECRQRIATLESEALDHAETRAQLEAQLAEAINAAEAAAQQLSLLSEQGTPPASIDESPSAPADPVSEVEQPLAAHDQETHDQEEIVEPTPVEAPAELAELPAEDGPASDLWGIDQLLTAEDQDAILESAPAETAEEQAEAPAEDSPASDLWEIEQLASLMPGEQPLWGAVSDESAVEAEPSAEEPVSEEPLGEELVAEEPVEEVAEEAQASAALWGDSPLASEVALPQPADPVDEINEIVEETIEETAQEATAQFEEPQPEPPVEQESFLEKYAHLLPDDDEPVTPAEPILAPEPEPAVEVGVGVADEEDSIDDYMQQLMERVRGGGPSDTAAKPEKPAPVASVAPAETPAEEPAPAPEPVVPIKDLSELKRSSTNEPPTDMVALRSLANQSARQALNIAAKKESREQATLKLTISAVALGCGAMAAITAANPFKLQFIIGLMAACVGGWFGLRTLRGCSKNAVDQLRDSIAE